MAIGRDTISVTQSQACAWAGEPGGRPALQGRPKSRGMGAASGGGRGGNLASLQPFSHPETTYTAYCTSPWEGMPLPWASMRWRINGLGGLLYAFPPFSLLHTLLQRVREEEVRLILVALNWPHMVWFSWITPLLDGRPWELPVRRDLLSQAHGAPAHTASGSDHAECTINESSIFIPLGTLCVMV